MKQNNIILNGIAASSGVAIGKVFVLEEDDFLIVKKVPVTSFPSYVFRHLLFSCNLGA